MRVYWRQTIPASGVIPAQAGIQDGASAQSDGPGIPAVAGMTPWFWLNPKLAFEERKEHRSDHYIPRKGNDEPRDLGYELGERGNW
jgi:hypothetical protein